MTANTIYVVQLPFPSLDYFPVPRYFERLQAWYRRAAGADCTVPYAGIWEIPLWVSWVRAALLVARNCLDAAFDVQIRDLSRAPFDVDAVLQQLPCVSPGDIYCLSPLTQNRALATRLAAVLRQRGMKAVGGGPVAGDLDAQDFDCIFVGKIETSFEKFLGSFAALLGAPRRNRRTDYVALLAEHLDYTWAFPGYHSQILYLRTFTHHGCPFACTFCADRSSGSSLVDPRLLSRELFSLVSTFPDHQTLYVGDSTFGVAYGAMSNLAEALTGVHDALRRALRLIVQTNPALVTPRFAANLRKLGVVLVELGIESGSSASVRRTQKFRPSNDWLEEKLRILDEAGLRVAANIIVGLPEDSEEDYEQTEAFILKWRHRLWFNVYGFVPYPGTQLYERLVRDQRIRNWNSEQWCEGGPFVFDGYYLDADSAYMYLIRILTAASGEGEIGAIQ